MFLALGGSKKEEGSSSVPQKAGSDGSHDSSNARVCDHALFATNMLSTRRIIKSDDPWTCAFQRAAQEKCSRRRRERPLFWKS